MDTMMALVGTPASNPHDGDFDELYGRYAVRLLAAAAEQLAEISPAAADLDEDLADAVWDAVEAGHYPEGRRGFAGLLVLLRDKVRRVRARSIAASEAIREVVIDLDDIADEPVTVLTTVRPLPATVSAAVAALRALPLAG
ncbi:hypothetical protein AB0D10_39850 [Kitasatospora sp. NPDC048545]|uniref:hypothetical protein n=1 Tax=Kitasatospora sp. NPDC048545 TaxID=3157208 RepID=UPI0033DBA636